jgi:hypothetical protein
VQHAVLSRCRTLGITCPRVLCSIFKTMVNPVLSYGCEVWAPDALVKRRGSGLAHQGPQDELLNGFMRQITGVPKSTPLHILHSELHMTPVWLFWLRQCVKFYNKNLRLPDHNIVKCAMLESIGMSLSSDACTECWGHSFLRCMCAIGQFQHPMQVKDGDGKLTPIELTRILKKAQEPVEGEWAAATALGGGSPRGIPDCHHDGVKLAVYAAWIAPGHSRDRGTDYTALLNRQQYIIAIAKMRMGAHDLNVNSMRWGANKVVRSKRTCGCCDGGTVEDELHFMLECPAYSTERRALLDALIDDGVVVTEDMNDCDRMRWVMNGNGTRRYWCALARYIIVCQRKRADILNRA